MELFFSFWIVKCLLYWSSVPFRLCCSLLLLSGFSLVHSKDTICLTVCPFYCKMIILAPFWPFLPSQTSVNPLLLFSFTFCKETKKKEEEKSPSILIIFERFRAIFSRYNFWEVSDFRFLWCHLRERQVRRLPWQPVATQRASGWSTAQPHVSSTPSHSFNCTKIISTPKSRQWIYFTQKWVTLGLLTPRRGSVPFGAPLCSEPRLTNC